jgi:hypothetical protein
VLPADDYTQLVTARLFDFFNRHAPWHLALWGIGTALALDEVIEYSDLTRAGAFPSKDGLRFVSSSTRLLVESDGAVGPDPLRDAVLAALADSAVTTEAGTTTLRHLADRVRDQYLSRLAAAARSTYPPGVEALSSAAAAHLLDLGFSNGFLHRWLRTLVKEDERSLHISDVLEEAAALCEAPVREFQVLIPFTAVPLGYPGPMPPGWLDAHQTAEWISKSDPPPQGDLRQAGSVLVDARARDQWSAVESAAELVTQASARVTVGSRMARLQVKGIGWIHNDCNVYPLRSQTRVQLRSLKTAEDVFRISVDASDAVLYDALEIFSALGTGSRGAALTGGWAAVESLLLRTGETPHILAADRLADIVACAFPRAELTTLSYRHRPSERDELASLLDGVDVNVERCRIVEASIGRGLLPVVLRPSDRALARRVQSMVDDPAEKLGNVRRYVSETVRRLYTQRNLIMHAGSFQSVTLRATLRTAPRLVAAGIDRILDAHLGGRPLDPLALAARAAAELGLVGTAASRRLSDLLD